MATIPADVLTLIEKFEAQADLYKSPTYNETQLRIDFINPLFKALGWDMDNTQGFAEAFREVVHEDAVMMRGTVKSPDYSFRIGGRRIFFLEAKKPSVNIHMHVEPAFQLRSYGWTAKLPLSILTNFREFAVYDCRVKPKYLDKASTARLLYFTCKDYPQRWDEIASIFSPAAIQHGAFDRFAASKKKSGTQDFDEAFLEEMESWRKMLANNLALRNDGLDQSGLNFATQRIIDRIIFLRICEDRGIEPPFQLQGLLSGDQTYARLRTFFTKADQRYNSGLFHFNKEKDRHEQPDELTPTLTLDDAILKQILKRLYYPDSPYVFKEVAADILGSVYERFLGNVIRLAGRRVKVEPKPEVRKAGGVYYTPTYIVDYIVRNAIGAQVEGKTAAAVSKLRFLDPACGSGSFLLGAYQYLINWHQRWYLDNDPTKWSKGRNAALRPGTRGSLVLSIRERKRILTNNIYGVDLDPQAVEVTKLSLLLKCLEGESQQSIDHLLLLHERALPDLGDNIKCGNSLIATEMYDTEAWKNMSREEQSHLRPFNWREEFPFVRKEGGFDAVIGNPPYVLLQDEFRDDAQLSYFKSVYRVASYKLDTYHLFIEKAVMLAAKCGTVAMITPANFLTNNHLALLRRFLLERGLLNHILVIDGGVFGGVSVDSAIFVLEAGLTTRNPFPIRHVRVSDSQLLQTAEIEISPDMANASPHVLFTGTAARPSMDLWRKVEALSVKLRTLCDVNFGKQLRDRKQFRADVIVVKSQSEIGRKYVPCYTGKDVMRYQVEWGKLACLKDDEARRGGCWDNAKHRAKNKLLTRQIGRYPEFGIDSRGFDCLNTIFMLNVTQSSTDPIVLLGILNSRLLRAYWLNHFYDQRRTFPKIKGTYLKELPIRTFDSTKKKDMAVHSRLVALVDQMLALHQSLKGTQSPSDKEPLRRQIDATDQQIDRLVYDLYELTEDEVCIVEKATPAK